MTQRLQGLSEYGIAIAVLVLATAVRWALIPLFSEPLPFLAYFLAVLIVSAAMAIGPSLFTLAAGAVLGSVDLGTELPAAESAAEVIRFLVVGGGIVVIFGIVARTRVERVLAESEQRFRALVEQLRDYAIFMMDPARKATSWNEGVKRVLGFDENEFVGLDVVPAIFTPEDIADGVADREFATAERVGTAGDDRWMMRKDGKRIYVLGVTVARRDRAGRLLGFAKIMRDRTEHKRLEDELRETAEQLARINRRQTDFLAMLSHEIRNPLASLRNGLDLMRMNDGAGSKGAATLSMMDRQFVHLVKLVDDLLDASRIASGKITLRKQAVDLCATADHAVEICQSQCNATEQQMVVDMAAGPIYLDADPTRLMQILTNLLHNACKFTPKGGRIELHIHAEAEQAVIRIVDTGIGIPPHYLHRIFDMFEQIERPLANQSGLGIGLGLTKSLVEMHGGTIQALSDGENQGSEFVIRLPRLPAAQLPSESGRPPKPLPGPLRILAVDDNRDAVDSLALILELDGHTVSRAYNGLDAIQETLSFEPDVVLLDIGLPDIDGYEVARAIRNEHSRPILLVAVTGWGQDEDRRKSREAGFDAHLTKPVDHEALLDLLGEWSQPVSSGGGASDADAPLQTGGPQS